MILLSVDGIQSEFDSDYVDSIQIQPSQEIFLTVDSENVEITEIVSDNKCIDPVHDIIEKSVEDQPIQNDNSDEEQTSRKKSSQHTHTTPKRVANDEKWTNWKPKSLRSKKHPALSAEKMKRPFERVAESKLDIAEVQKQILEEELLNKRKRWAFEEEELLNKKKQWAFEEEEREHKREMWALEKKYFLNKFEI